MATKESLARLITAASIGNAFEWFDIAVYGYFALSISRVFFPPGNEGLSMLLTYGTFDISFIARPVGAIWVGAIADRFGRRNAMLVSMSLMMLGTLAIGLMPTYGSIGLFGGAEKILD